MVKENYCNCLWCVWKPAQPEVNDRGLTCFNGSSFGLLINTRSSSPWEITQKHIFCPKILLFFSFHEMYWIFVVCFPKMKGKDMPISFQFHKTPKRDQEKTLLKGMGLCICFAWHLQSQQFAGISPPSPGCLESCGCSLKGQVPPGPEWLWTLCPGWGGAEPPSPHGCRKQLLLSKHRNCFLFPRWWEETKDPNCHSQAHSLLCAWTRTYYL